MPARPRIAALIAVVAPFPASSRPAPAPPLPPPAWALPPPARARRAGRMPPAEVDPEPASAEATEALAAELAATLGAGDVVLVSGELGAGKTTFVRGAC